MRSAGKGPGIRITLRINKGRSPEFVQENGLFVTIRQYHYVNVRLRLLVTSWRYEYHKNQLFSSLLSCISSDIVLTWRLSASKVSLLITCSMRQASSAAICGSTPIVVSQLEMRVCRS